MPKSDTAVAAFGRFNPPTKGHLKLVNKLKAIPGDHYLFISHTQDAEKNPLDYDTKVSYAKKFFEGVHIGDKGCETIYDVLNKLKDMGYDHLVYVCGEDEYEPFTKLIREYNEKNNAFESVKIVQAGDREEDSEGTDGISATKVRQLAKDGDYEEFCDSIPDRKYAKGLYNDLRLAMKLDEDVLDEIEPNDIDMADAKAISGPIHKTILNAVNKNLIDNVPHITVDGIQYSVGLYPDPPKYNTTGVYVHNKGDLVAQLDLEPTTVNILGTNFEIMIVDYAMVGTNYQRKNIGFTLYKDLITKAQYNLGAYKTQSPGAQLLWKKLFTDSEISLCASNDFSNKRGKVEVYPVVMGPDGNLAAKVKGKVVSLYGWGNTMGIIATVKGGPLDQKILGRTPATSENYMPPRYKAGLSPSTAKKRRVFWTKLGKYPYSKSEYEKAKHAPGDSKETTPSKYTLAYKNKFGEDLNENAALDKTLATKSKASGIPRGILRQVYNRGMAAWVTGHRPGASQQAWGMGRVNSFIVKGKTWHTTDSDLAKKVRSEQVDEAHDFKYIYWGWIGADGKIYDKPESTHTIHAKYVRDILIGISNPNDATDNSYGMSQYKAFNQGWVRFFLTPEYEMHFSVYLGGFKLTPKIYTAITQVLDRAHKVTKRPIFRSYNFENSIDRPLNPIEVADPHEFLKKLRNKYRGVSEMNEAHEFKYIYWGWIGADGKIYDKPKSTHTLHAEYVRDILIDISNPNDATDNFDHTDSYEAEEKAFNRGWVRFFLTQYYEMFFSVYSRGFKLSPTISTAIKQVLDRAHKVTKRPIFKSYNFENSIDLRRPLNAIEVADPDEFLKKLRNKYRGVSEMNEAHLFNYPYWGWISPVGEVFLPTRKDEGLHDHIIQHVTDGKIKSAERGMNIGWVRFFIELDDNSMHFETINIDKVNFSKVSSKIKSIVNMHLKCSAFNFEWLPSTPPAYAKKRHIEEDDPDTFTTKVRNVLRMNEDIVHSKNGWTLFSKKTHKRLGGPYPSKEQAIKRERQVSYFKHMGENNIKTFKQFSEEQDELQVDPKGDQEVLLEVTAPKEVKDNATDGLELRSKFNRGGNSDTIKTANKLLKEPFDESDLKNLLVKLTRHDKEKKTGWDDPEAPSNGFIAWMMLGGDAGKLWAEKSLSSTGKSTVKEESLNEVSPEGIAAMRRMGMQQDPEGDLARANYEKITKTKWSPPEDTNKKQPTPETSKTKSELSSFLSQTLGFEYKKEEIIPGRPGMVRYVYSNSGKVYKMSGWTLRVYYRRMRQTTSQPIGVTGWYLFSPDSEIEEYYSGKTMEQLISFVEELKQYL